MIIFARLELIATGMWKKCCGHMVVQVDCEIGYNELITLSMIIKIYKSVLRSAPVLGPYIN